MQESSFFEKYFMQYTEFEDKAIQILRDHIISDTSLRPRWRHIVDLMNAKRETLNASKGPEHEYTVAMLRNRYQRMTNTRAKRKRTHDKCDDLADMVYNIFGIDNPNIKHLPVSNDVFEQIMLFDVGICERELYDFFELLRSYDDDPDPIEKYKVTWDSIE